MEKETTEQEPAPPAEPKAPRARKFGCGRMALCGLGLVLLVGGIWYAKLCAARKEFLRHAEALVAEIEAERPYVPDDESAAPLHREAFKLYVRPSNLAVSNDESIWLESAKNIVKVQPDVVAKYLKANEPYLAALRKTMERQKCDFRPTFRSAGSLAGDDVPGAMRNAARFLCVAARVKAREGKAEEAVELLSMGLRASRDAGSNGTLIALMVQLACEGVARAGVENLFEDCDPNAALIEKLAQETAKHSSARGAMGPVLRTDKAVTLHAVFGPLVSGRESAQKLATGLALQEQLFVDPFEEVSKPPLHVRGMFWAWQHCGYVLKDAHYYESGLDRYIAAAAKPYPQALDEAEVLAKGFNEKPGWWAFLSEPSLAAMGRVVVSDARAEAKLCAARLGLGCRLYKLKFGAYPEKLSELSAKLPEHFKTLPADPFTGKDMIYKRTDQGCKVYSVGDNRKDDGGTPFYDQVKKKFNKDYDWVFELKR